jgi:hypothetical protein
MESISSGNCSVPLKTSQGGNLASSSSQPSWGFIFGLVLIIIFIGFLLIYIVFRNKKQEKQIELLLRRTQQMQTEMVNLVEESTQNSHNAAMRNVFAMVDTRLNDFDQYCRTHFLLRSQQPVTSEQFSEPPPLEENTCSEAGSKSCQLQSVATSASQSSNAATAASQSSNTATVTTSIPSTSLPSLATSAPSTIPRRSRNLSSLSPSTENPPVAHTSGSGSASTSASASASSNGLTSLVANILSNMNGLNNNSSGDSGGVSIPMVLGEIMTVYTNQQARQSRLADDDSPSLESSKSTE